MEAICIDQLNYRFPDGTEALRGFSLTLEAGVRAAIMGPNGAGKSTLVQHLNGLLLAPEGVVTIMGEPVRKQNLARIRSRVGIVFQNPDDQVFSSTVWEDVCFGPANLGLPPAEVAARAEAALETSGMAAYKERPPHRLSYGQKKRVAIAGVLAMEPDIVVLDEPMAFLDPRGQDELAEMLTVLHGLGKTVLVTTHDVDFASEWAEQVVLMREGRLLATGGTELLTDPTWIREAQLHLPRVARPFLQVPELRIPGPPRNEKEAAALLRQLAGGGAKSSS